MVTAADVSDNWIATLVQIGKDLPPEVRDVINDALTPMHTLGELKGLSKETLETMYSVAHSLYQSNQYEKAREIFQTLTLMDHFEFKYYFGLASCYQMEKNYQLAAELYGICFIFQPKDPAVPFHCAYCHLQLKNYEAAESGFYAAAQWAGDQAQYADLKDRAEVMEKLARRKREEQSTANQAVGDEIGAEA